MTLKRHPKSLRVRVMKRERKGGIIALLPHIIMPGQSGWGPRRSEISR